MPKRTTTSGATVRLLPAHRDACFRLMRLPKASDSSRVLESHWISLTSTTTDSIGIGNGNDTADDDGTASLPLESRLLRALLLLRLLQAAGEEEEEDVSGGGGGGDSSAGVGTEYSKTHDLWTDLLRVRQYLLKTIRDPRRNPGAGSGPENRKFASVLGVAHNLYLTLSPSQGDDDDGSSPPTAAAAAPPPMDFLSAEEARRCRTLLKRAGADTLAVLLDREVWGRLWDTASASSSRQYGGGDGLILPFSLPTPSSPSPPPRYFYGCGSFSPLPSSLQWQVLTWQWSCFLSAATTTSASASSSSYEEGKGKDGNNNNNNNTAAVATCSENSWRVAAGASMGLFLALQHMFHRQQSPPSTSETNDKEGEPGGEKVPPSKRARETTPLDALLEVANGEDSSSSFTRWRAQGSVSGSKDLLVSLFPGEEEENKKDHPNGKADGKVRFDLLSAALATLAKALWKETRTIVEEEQGQVSTNNPAGNSKSEDNETEEEEFDTSQVPLWVQKHVLRAVEELPSGGDAAGSVSWKAVWRYLPQTTSRLYYHHPSEKFPYLDTVELVRGMDSVNALVGGLDQQLQGAQVKDGTEGTPTVRPTPLRSASLVPRRAVTPPVYTEGMELTEWAVSLLYLEQVQPSRKLVDLLDNYPKALLWKSNLYSTLQTALQRLLEEYTHPATTVPSQKEGGIKNPRLAVVFSETPGKFVCVSSPRYQSEIQSLVRAVMAFFYHALQAILMRSQSPSSQKDTADAITEGVVEDPAFDRALLACCLACVTRAVATTQKLRPLPPLTPTDDDPEDGSTSNAVAITPLPIYTILSLCESHPYDFFKVSDLFLLSLTTHPARDKLQSPLPLVLPRLLVREIQQTKVHVMDSLLWVRNDMPDNGQSTSSPSSPAGQLLPDRIEQNRRGWQSKFDYWPPEVLVFPETELVDFETNEAPEQSRSKIYPAPGNEGYNDYCCVSVIFRHVLQLAETRIRAMCEFLGISPLLPVSRQVFMAFAFLLRHHMDALDDRHLDPLILCCLYGVSKTMRYKPDLTFAGIIDAYVVVRGQELGDVTCQRIVRHIRLTHDNNTTDDAPIGNVIMLYNKVFVPRMKDHLLKSESLKRATESLRVIFGEKSRSPMKSEKLPSTPTAAQTTPNNKEKEQGGVEAKTSLSPRVDKVEEEEKGGKSSATQPKEESSGASVNKGQEDPMEIEDSRPAENAKPEEDSQSKAIADSLSTVPAQKTGVVAADQNGVAK